MLYALASGRRRRFDTRGKSMMFSFATFRKASAPAAPKADLEGDALFESLVLEIHEVSTDIAVVMSVINAFARDQDARPLSQCRNFFPRPSPLARLALSARSQPSPILETSRYLESLARDLPTAIASMETLIETFERRHEFQPTLRLVGPCSAQWQAISRTAVAAVNALEPETRWRLSGLYSENSLMLVRTLRAVLDGKSPSVTVDGHILRLDLPQRRRLPRVPLQKRCTIHHRGGQSPAYAVDVSLGGMGLCNAPKLALREGVEIELPRGRRLQGTVAWSSAGKLGIKFLDPLPPDDPLVAR